MHLGNVLNFSIVFYYTNLLRPKSILGFVEGWEGREVWDRREKSEDLEIESKRERKRFRDFNIKSKHDNILQLWLIVLFLSLTLPDTT